MISETHTHTHILYIYIYIYIIQYIATIKLTNYSIIITLYFQFLNTYKTSSKIRNVLYRLHYLLATLKIGTSPKYNCSVLQTYVKIVCYLVNEQSEILGIKRLHQWDINFYSYFYVYVSMYILLHESSVIWQEIFQE